MQGLSEAEAARRLAKDGRNELRRPKEKSLIHRFLEQLQDLMYAAYSNRKDIRVRVASMVSTYHPDNPPVTVVKDRRYVALVAGEELRPRL